MLYCLPLEPLDERYTRQWYRWFKQDCKKLGVDCHYVDGDQLGTKVEVGTVLDAAGTNFWKATQIAQVCRLFKERRIEDGDIFFTMDMWHPALEMIPYMATLYGLDVKVYAFLHAGSYTTEDFAAPMSLWAQWFERGWFSLCEGIFTGTEYHKQKFLSKRLNRVFWQDWSAKRIHVTGYPIRMSEMPELNIEPRENIIIFSHRWDREKRPNDFVNAMQILWKERQDFRVVIPQARGTLKSNDPQLLRILDNVSFPYEIKDGSNKQVYYGELNKARVFVSTTIEEGFGYCLVESMAMGVHPVVRNDFSHPEIVKNEGSLFNDLSECVQLCSEALDMNDYNPRRYSTQVTHYEESFVRMLEVMTNG